MGKRRCAVAALSLVLLAGCGQAGPTAQPGGTVPATSSDDGDGSPTPTSGSGGSATPTSDAGGSATPSPGSGEPTVVPGEVRLQGTVETGVEANCVVLRTAGGKTYELSGGASGTLVAGSQVVVRGKIRTDLMSTCMQGPIVQVIEVWPA